MTLKISLVLSFFALNFFACRHSDKSSSLASEPNENKKPPTLSRFDSFVNSCASQNPSDSNLREYCAISALYSEPSKTLVKRIFTYDSSKGTNICLTNKLLEGGLISWDACVYNSLHEDVAKAQMQKWSITSRTDSARQQLLIYNILTDQSGDTILTYLNYGSVTATPQAPLKLTGTTINLGKSDLQAASIRTVNRLKSAPVSPTFNPNIFFFDSLPEAQGAPRIVYFLSGTRNDQCLSKYYDRNELTSFDTDTSYYIDPATNMPKPSGNSFVTKNRMSIEQNCLSVKFSNFYVGR